MWRPNRDHTVAIVEAYYGPVIVEFHTTHGRVAPIKFIALQRELTVLQRIIAAHQHLMWGLLCIALGLFPLAILTGVVPNGGNEVLAPQWVLALCGTIFVIAGAMMIVGQHSPLNDLLAAVLCTCFAAIGLWISLFAPADGFSGGVPGVSWEGNVRIARWVFAGGAIVCVAIALIAARRTWRRLQRSVD